MKKKGKSLNDVLKRQLKDPGFQLLFDEHRFYLQIAKLIVQLRSKEGLSQAEIAKKTGVSQPMIARIEKGDPRRKPTFDTIYKILKALGYQLALDIKPSGKKVA